MNINLILLSYKLYSSINIHRNEQYLYSKAKYMIRYKKSVMNEPTQSKILSTDFILDAHIGIQLYLKVRSIQFLLFTSYLLLYHKALVFIGKGR